VATEQGAPCQFRLSRDYRSAEAGFQRAPLPVGAGEQVGAQRSIAQVKQPAPLALQTLQGNDRPGQYPGLVVAAQADFPYPGVLTVGNAQAPGLFLCRRCKALPADLNVKGMAALFLQGPCKRTLNLQPIAGRPVNLRV